jgi:hypothetical protein
MRYQFVWWGWWDWRLFIDGQYRTIFDWRVRVGPLELRKWTRVQAYSTGDKA